VNVTSSNKPLAWAGVFCLVIGLFACGDDDDFGTNNGVGTLNNGTSADTGTDTTADASDAFNGEDAVGGDVDAGGFDDSGDGGPDADTGGGETTDLCNANSLGEISANGSGSATSYLGDAEDNFELSCASGSADELVYTFSLEQASRVTINPTSSAVSEWNLQINRGQCETTRRVACFNQGDEVVFLDAGVEYFVILEPSDGATSGQVTLELQTEALQCFPSGSTQCVGDDVQVCQSNFTPLTSSCSFGCSDDSCRGDTCENPIEMDPIGSMLVEGALSGFTSEYNFGSRDECFASGFGLSSRGSDVTVALDGLSTGQIVHVDASQVAGDFNDNTIFIVDSCGSTPACVTGGDDETLDWEVPADGDYVLIVDTVSESEDSFAYQIDIEDPQ
jgi:hypothetical protein